MRRAFAYYKKHFLLFEFAIAVLLGLVFLCWALLYGGDAVLRAVMKNRYGAIYGTLTSVFASMLGFMMATVSIIIGFMSSDKLAVVRRSRHYLTLWRIFVQAIWFLFISTLYAFLCLVLNPDGSTCAWMVYPLVPMTVLVALRLARGIWVLEKVIGLIGKPETD
jgi:uncharacterized membrane protein